MPVLESSRRLPVTGRLVLPGWSPRSRWGWDPGLECFWARLVARGTDGTDVEVSREHLLPTLASLARAVAARTGIDAGLVFVALTGGPVVFEVGPAGPDGGVPDPRQARYPVSA